MKFDFGEYGLRIIVNSLVMISKWNTILLDFVGIILSTDLSGGQ